MVGRKTSPACAICRKRRVKCDLASPACSGCISHGWECPGYDLRVVTFSTSQYRRDRVMTTKPASVPLNVMLSDADVLRLKYIPKLEGNLLAARLVMMPASTVLKYIPARIGGSSALDDAVRCLLNEPSQDLKETARRYLKALRSLQCALQDDERARSPETLAAAMLLHMHELFVDEPGQDWITHARGTICMLKLRGPSHMRDDVEKAALYAQSGNIFMAALEAREPCFLATPAWTAVLVAAAKPEYGAGALSPLIVYGVQLPGLLLEYGKLARSSKLDAGQLVLDDAALVDVTPVRKEIQGVLIRLNDLRAMLRVKWYSIEASCVSTAGNIQVFCFVIMVNCMLNHTHYIAGAVSESVSTSYGVLPTPWKLYQETSAALESVQAQYATLIARDGKLADSVSAAIRRILTEVIDEGAGSDNIEIQHIRQPLFELRNLLQTST